MYKHQVIGIRREASWRSRQSEHIVGMCTLEAVDADGRFENFDSEENWWANHGVIRVEPSDHDGLTPACRYWSLEEVLEALRRSTPRHEFYTREPKKGRRKIPVFSYLGSATDLFTRSSEDQEVPVYCDEDGGWLYTKVRGRRVRFNTRSGALFVRVPGSDEQEVERRVGALVSRSGDEVECRAGDVHWVKTRGDDQKPGNLHSLVETPVDCPQKRCTVIPRAARPVSRGYGPDG